MQRTLREQIQTFANTAARWWVDFIHATRYIFKIESIWVNNEHLTEEGDWKLCNGYPTPLSFILKTSIPVPLHNQWSHPLHQNSLVICPFLNCSTRFLTLPRRFSNLDVSIDAALLRTDLPGFASGFSIHQEDLPVPSFWTRIKRLCKDKLCLIEFCKDNEE
jgi:hypothetical protein